METHAIASPQPVDSKGPGELQLIEVANVDADVEPSEPKKRKRKHKHRSKSSCSNKSRKCIKSHSECRLSKEVAACAEEEENTKVLKEVTTWCKEARKELKTSSCKVAKLEGEKLVPD
ncbi:UNVERIFIED_CONTAM: hypothetical protein Slati_1713000 [Sesamum latifolium]|uniref:Uncharacterized protein n=1 Tax=Sesamum latifolium TaxID=2727402 RepID=A0AAW2WX11_9LAMI